MQPQRTLSEPAAVAAFVVLSALPFLGKAYHIDEPAYLAIAGHIARDPLHPLSFLYNWYGRAVPMSEVNAYPTILPYLLAAAAGLTRGLEWRTRLAFLPFDLAAGLALYGLAARLLKRPLWPTLTILAGPAYLLNIQHIMPDKLLAAFGLTSLYLLLRGLDEGRSAWIRASAALMMLALLSKITGIFLLLLAALAARRRRQPWRGVILYGALAAGPLLLFLGKEFAGDAWGGIAATGLWFLNRGAAFHAGDIPGRLRALLCFTGGCGLATLPGGFLLLKDGRRWAALAAAGAAAALLLPVFDTQAVAALDRALGAAFAAAAGLSVAVCLRPEARRGEERRLLLAWIFIVGGLQLLFYWSIVTRYVLFLLIPLALLQAHLLEETASERTLRRLYLGSFLSILALSLTLAAVDARYAAAQRDTADAARRYVAAGKRVWFTGHWGFQYYMEKAGAVAVDRGAGGWAAARAGDILIVPVNNTNILSIPMDLRIADVRAAEIGEAVPLRLISAGRAGFYSSVFGFLPFAVSGEPLERFYVAKRL